MSGGFSFPPPPPPPPPSSSATDNQWQSSNSGRGGRGRGRGQGMRGRGNSGNPTSSYGARPGDEGRQNLPSSVSQLPAGTHINPAFGQGQARNDRNTGAHDIIPRTAAGHKRKLDALRGPPERRTNGPPAALAAPAVPSFGALTIATPTAIPQKPKQNQTPAGNSLGLTPATAGDQQYDSSEEDNDEDEDVDEEAAHAELGAQLTFEHNGTILALSTAADIANWQRERRRKFPTAARIAEKEVERIKTGEERRRLLAAASQATRSARPESVRAKQARPEPAVGVSSNDVPARKETGLERAKRGLSEKTAELDRLRQQVAAGQERLKRAEQAQAASPPPAAPLPLVSGSGYDEDDSSEILSESSVVSSDSSVDDDDSDDAPVESSSKQPTVPQTKKRPCRYFVASGHCRDGDACPFYHDPRIKAAQARNEARRAMQAQTSTNTSTSRKSIYDRLVQQEQDEMDRLALKVIKYLGGTGLFKDISGGAE